jgi:arylsulfatase A-like enzyme
MRRGTGLHPCVWIGLGLLAACSPRGREPRDESIRIETVTRDLMDEFAQAEVVERAPSMTPGLDGLQPSPHVDAHGGGYRRAIVAPPGTVIRYRVRVPPAAVLRYGVGVARDTRQDRNASGIRFDVAIDGRPRASRVVNPARSRHHRRWFDERLSLAPHAGREIEVTLTTSAEAGRALAGMAGWSAVRVVRERHVERQPARPETPNVIVLLVDTLRADRLGCYGAVPSPSPTLDRLAATGLVFERASAQAPWTMPSVASLFTGLHPRAHGVLGGSWDWGRPPGTDTAADFAYLSDRVPTFAELALASGITTFGVSTNPTVTPATNLARGFETFLVLEGRGEERWAAAADVNARFLAWARERRGDRFLAYLHSLDTHDPYAPPDRYAPEPPVSGVRRAVARGRIHPLRAQRRGEGTPLRPAEVAHLGALYAGEIHGWDDALAHLLGGLEALGLRDQTNVIVTADHGEELQEHGRLGHGSQLFEESLHVPLVLAGPSVAAGRRADLVQGIDLLPTVLGLLDVAQPPGLPGRDVRATTDGGPVVAETRYGIGPDGESIELVAVRQGDAKLVHAPTLGTLALYDLAANPGETHPVRDAARTALLLRTLERWRRETPRAQAAEHRDPALAEKLQALGYLD